MNQYTGYFLFTSSFLPRTPSYIYLLSLQTDVFSVLYYSSSLSPPPFTPDAGVTDAPARGSPADSPRAPCPAERPALAAPHSAATCPPAAAACPPSCARLQSLFQALWDLFQARLDSVRKPLMLPLPLRVEGIRQLLERALPLDSPSRPPSYHVHKPLTHPSPARAVQSPRPRSGAGRASRPRTGWPPRVTLPPPEVVARREDEHAQHVLCVSVETGQAEFGVGWDAWMEQC